MAEQTQAYLSWSRKIIGKPETIKWGMNYFSFKEFRLPFLFPIELIELAVVMFKYLRKIKNFIISNTYSLSIKWHCNANLFIDLSKSVRNKNLSLRLWGATTSFFRSADNVEPLGRNSADKEWIQFKFLMNVFIYSTFIILIE